MEMTGLVPETDRIIEIAVVVTDAQLTTRAEGPVLVIHQSDEMLDGDGLLEHGHARQERPDRARARLDARRGRGRAPADRVPAAARAAEHVADVRQHHLPGPALSGASRCRSSRRFFHYRNLDVSTLKELAQALEAARSLAGFKQGAGARGARRHPRVDRRAGLLPRALPARRRASAESHTPGRIEGLPPTTLPLGEATARRSAHPL